jgi:two-component system, NarL family, invasion response regulator UvrY
MHAPSEPIRILIADDNDGIRKLITALARTPGITVVAEACNGVEAIDEASRHQPDVVLLDFDMPVMDGLSAIPGILAVSPATRIVMYSTHQRVRDDCLAAGAHGWITKGTPWTRMEAILVTTARGRSRACA